MEGARGRKRVRRGDRLVVGGRPERAVVDGVFEEEPGSTKIVVDWGELGKSKVYEHDEGRTWRKYEDVH